METNPAGARPTLKTALILLANLSTLMVVSVSISVQQDNNPDLNSGSPVTDGAVTTVLVVMALVLLNGVLLCSSPNTRRVGVGAIVAFLVSLPIGLVVSLLALSSSLGDS